MNSVDPANRGNIGRTLDQIADNNSEPLGIAAQIRSMSFLTQDSRLFEILDVVSQVADTDATVLITGESGTGKEFIARALHENGSRRTAAFIAVNCGAIAENLQESELFGHVRGAFTGATEDKTGKFEAADGGTIFLDEIPEMSRTLQAKLLRVLQHGEYAPVGFAKNRYCNVRVVAATNQNLQPLIEVGKFRQDLYYRLNIIRLELPPLRQRPGDIPLLITHFLRLFSAAYQKSERHISDEARQKLLEYDYPGNVRELENILRRAVILGRESVITCRQLPPEVLYPRRTDSRTTPASFHEAKARAVEEFEQAFLIDVLKQCGGIISRAAQCCGLSERNFHGKLNKYHIHGASFRT